MKWKKPKMKCEFFIGQEVVCINDNPNEPPNVISVFGDLDGLKVGNQYTVKDIYIDARHNVVCITVFEIYRGVSPMGYEHGYFAFRFRPIIKKQTDISALEKFLRIAEKELEEV